MGLWLSILLLTASASILLVHLFERYHTSFFRLEQEWAHSLEEEFSKEFLFLHPKQFRQLSHALLCLGLLAYFLIDMPILSLLVLPLGWVAPSVVLFYLRRSRRSHFERQFVVALPQLASVLRAGHTVERALEALAETQANPLAQEVEFLLKEVRMGLDLDGALQNLSRRFPSTDVEMVVRAVAISRRVGSNLAEALDRVADMLRTRLDLRDRLNSLTAQGKVQAVTAIAIPIAFLVFFQLFAPGFLAPLFQTRIGHSVLGLASVLLSAGGLWVYRISRTELIR